MLFTMIELPNGTKLKNRIAKAAMEENMADIEHGNCPSEDMIRLYSEWAQGGSALVISGHVMVDSSAMAAAGSTCLSEKHMAQELYCERYQRWCDASRKNNTKFWLQLNHPGRQMPKTLGLTAKAPSAVGLNLGRAGKTMFDVPTALTHDEILTIIDRFAEAAKLAEDFSADGVQIHSAHGYLISQFLSPLSNRRDDCWGGPLENRARLLFEVVKKVRKVVKPTFGVGVKLNSADFQRGGFGEEDSLWVIQQLNGMDVDLVEVSGGSFESPVMSSGVEPKENRTLQREAYFLKFAEAAKQHARMPLMVTGGIKDRTVADLVVKSGGLIAGIATAMGLTPDLPKRLENGENPRPDLVSTTSWVLPNNLIALAKTKQVNFSMRLIGQGKPAKPDVWPFRAMLSDFFITRTQTRQWNARL